MVASPSASLAAEMQVVKESCYCLLENLTYVALHQILCPMEGQIRDF